MHISETWHPQSPQNDCSQVDLAAHMRPSAAVLTNNLLNMVQQ
jgi:hypothetical protein